jgi:hypothetical protein
MKVSISKQQREYFSKRNKNTDIQIPKSYKKILSSTSFEMKRAVTKELELLISDNSKEKENKWNCYTV